MNSENQSKKNQASRWLNALLRVYTLGKPVNTLLKRLRQGAQSTQTAQENVQTTDMRQRLNELSSETRQWVAGQVKQLNEQARQMQAQSRQLRKALLHEARQRRKLVRQIRKSGVDLSQDLLKRSENVTGELVERGGKVTQDLLERSGQAARDLAERSGEFAQQLAERSGKVTHDLARRGEHLLEPVRKRDRNFWSIVGFVAGLALAGFVTYRLVRRRVTGQQADQGEHIELPQSETWKGMRHRPAGRHLEREGATVATLQAVDVEGTDRPAGAVFIGVLSTKQYHPIDTPLELEDVIYFASAEEAQARGFTAAQ
jgi:gas vesicle protein